MSEGEGGKVSERKRDSEGVEREGDIKSTNKAREVLLVVVVKWLARKQRQFRVGSSMLSTVGVVSLLLVWTCSFIMSRLMTCTTESLAFW